MEVSDTEDSYLALLRACDYDYSITKNMAIIIVVLASILLVWFTCVIIDLICNKSQKRFTRSSWCQNFILRFLYEFFFEFCICFLLQLVYIAKVNENNQIFQYVLFVLLILVVMAFIAFIISQFFYRGPWVPGFYEKGTLV